VADGKMYVSKIKKNLAKTPRNPLSISNDVTRRNYF
jgi:hypothetical protein